MLELGRNPLLVDVGALSGSTPRPADDLFGQRMAMRNLADMWRNHMQAVNLLPGIGHLHSCSRDGRS